MSEEEQVLEMIEEMYEEYIEGGFDFSTSDTFDEIFKRIFTDAVQMTIAVFEQEDETEEA